MATGRWLAKQRVRSVFIYKHNEQLSLSSCQAWKVIKVQQTTQRGQPLGLGGVQSQAEAVTLAWFPDPGALQEGCGRFWMFYSISCGFLQRC